MSQQLSLLRERTRADELFDDFARFHRANPLVWQAFTKYALEAAKTRDTYSARDVIHRVRWHMVIETKSDDGLKINNNHSPFYGRMFEVQHPEHAGLFKHRHRVSTDAAATGSRFRGARAADDDRDLCRALRALLEESKP